MNLKFKLLVILLFINIINCKVHSLVPNSSLKNINALLTHVDNRWDIRMTVANASGMSVSAVNESLLIQTHADENHLIASWSVDDARIKEGKPFKLTIKSQTESFPVELIIPPSTKNGYTFVMIAKILSGH